MSSFSQGQAYGVGGFVKLQPPALSGQGAPAATLRGALGQEYVDTLNDAIYAYSGDTWVLLGGGSGDVNTLTGNTGGPVFPTAGNINIVGTETVEVAGSGSTLTISASTGGFPITPYVVGPVGQAGYQTIQSALNAIGAAGSGQIWLYPGTYTENLTFPTGINVGIITGSDENAGSATIVGTHLPPNNGNIVTWRVQLSAGASGHIFSDAGANNCQFACVHNNFICNGYIFNLPNYGGASGFNIGLMADRLSTASGVVNNTGGAFFASFNNSLGVGATFPTILSGFTILQTSNWGCPITTQGSAFMEAYDCNFRAAVTLGGSTQGFMTRNYHTTGAAAALTYSSSGSTLFTQATINSSNNPAIAGAGAGTLTLGDINFVNNSAIAGTLTTAWTATKTGALTITGAIVGSTTITATAGAITATNGNLVLGTAGNKIISTSVGTTTAAGANSFGSVALAGGNAIVATTAVTANSLIHLSRQGVNASTALGSLTITTKTAGVSFVIDSVDPSNPVAIQTSDESTIFWQIVN